jgi:site-specific DNA recombinase
MNTYDNEHQADHNPVAYMRVSTDEQRERATILTQRVEIEKYAAAHGMMVGCWYSDDGFSGRKLTLGQRPDGARLLVDAKEGATDTIIVYRADRLGRGRKLLASLDELEEAGVRYIISVTEARYDLRNPNDEFHLTMLSGVSGYEASGFLQRSKDATNRLAREGVWLGGIVPYGYHVEGVDREARLVVSEEPLPGHELSEADVIRLMYRRSTEDNWSCLRIADELNTLGIPPAYQRDGRTMLRGKRARLTQGIWRPGRIRSMLVNTTYKGLHQYGKRTEDPDREIIERTVPAIVDAETWEQAQAALRARLAFSPRNGKHDYLLRGLVICSLCGLHYCGVQWLAGGRRKKSYYRCGAASHPRAIYGTNDQRCPSKAVNGVWLEKVVWTDIETFLRDPGDVLAQLAETMKSRENRVDKLRDELAGLKLRRGSKQAERDTVIGLYRRGRIDAATLDRQLDQIAEEESELQDMISEREAMLTDAQRAGEELRSAEALLQDLRTRLGTSLDFSTRRRIVEILVERVTVDTITDDQGKKQATITVRYRFDAPAITTRTGTDSSRRPA